jgi:hypothetical protein
MFSQSSLWFLRIEERYSIPKHGTSQEKTAGIRSQYLVRLFLEAALKRRNGSYMHANMVKADGAYRLGARRNERQRVYVMGSKPYRKPADDYCTAPYTKTAATAFDAYS